MSTAAPAYLDYNATAPIRPGALEALTASLVSGGNPSSVHATGRAARRRIEAARSAVAALVNGLASDVIFTSGGTEANNLAILGSKPRCVVASAVEHDAVLAPAHSSGAEVRLIRVDRDGRLDLEHLEQLLATAPREGTLVSVMLANNETGVIHPVAEVAARARARGAIIHCDAVQAAGKIAIDIGALNVDLLTLSAHKLGGPQGAGALVARVDVDPVQRGGGQERGLRAGTENVAAIVAFGAAAEAALAELSTFAQLAGLRDDLERRIAALAPDVVFHGGACARLPNTSCIGTVGLPAETQVMALDLAGVAVSAGAACSSGKLRPSHVLTAMGHAEDAARAAIRVSLGWGTTPADIDRCVEAWSALYRRTRTAKSAA